MRRLLLIICILQLVVGCQSELPIDVPNTAGLPVIEANVSATDYTAIVRLTRSVNLTGIDTVVIDNAKVRAVNLTNSNRYDLNYIKGGYYTSKLVVITEHGDSWKLEVDIDDNSYAAFCDIKPAVPIDSLVIKPRAPIMGQVDESHYTAYLHFTDPVGSNFYHLCAWVNNKLASGITVFNDVSFEGQPNVLPYNVKLESGDVLRVELQSISQEIYQYYFELKQAQSSVSNSPANPTSNIVQTAGVDRFLTLGYFSAYCSSKKEIKRP